MDSANTQVRAQDRFSVIEEALIRHESQMQAALNESRAAASLQEQAIQTLADQVQKLTNLFSAHAAAPPSATAPPQFPVPAPEVVLPPIASSEPRIGAPERYGGEPGGCKPFITNCSIYFALQPSTFASEGAKVAFAVNHLTGRARLWGTAEWDRRTTACSSFKDFSAELLKVFDSGDGDTSAARSLLQLKQGSRSVVDYSIDFRILASRSNWNPGALLDAFLHGLSDYIKDELACRDLPADLDSLIALSIRVDQRIRARRHEKQQMRHLHPQSPSRHLSSTIQLEARDNAPTEDPEPMQLGRTQLTPEERQRRRTQNLCLYCGQSGHFLARCPVKVRAQQ